MLAPSHCVARPERILPKLGLVMGCIRLFGCQISPQTSRLDHSEAGASHHYQNGQVDPSVVTRVSDS